MEPGVNVQPVGTIPANPSEVCVRKLSKVDAKIATEAIKAINASIHWSRHGELILHKHLKEDSIVFAFKDNEIIGRTINRPYTEGKKHEHPHMYISFIAVSFDKRGEKGNFEAYRMMENVIKKAREARAAKLVVEYRGNNEKTKSFYQKVAKNGDLQIKNKERGTYANSDPKHKFTYYL